MDKTALPPPPIANTADYIDALTRPITPESVGKKKVIPGRRMRDKFRVEEVSAEVVKNPG